MTHRVIFHPRARRELNDLYDYIAEQSGHDRAGDFVGQIKTYCLGFATFPERGTKRDDIEPGVRMVGFRRRVSIVFSVDPATVFILGIFYGGRNVELGPWDQSDDDTL